MLFSLIIGTLNRVKEIVECLDSIASQTLRDFEIIIVDQSPDDGTKEAVNQFDLNIKYFHVDFEGLSKARNYGIKYSVGDYVCMMDDDAVYPKDFLENTEKIIKTKTNCIISGIILSIEDHKTSFMDYSNLKEGQLMNCTNILTACPSAALIIPHGSFSKTGGFDERLGVGNSFAAGEETDFLLRAMDNGYSVVHSKNIVVFHPIKPVDNTNLKPVLQHYMGKGALVKKDIKANKTYRLIPFATRNIVGPIIRMMTLEKENRIVYRTRLNGFLKGYTEFKP